MMVKKINFNLLVDGKSIGDFERMQGNFSAVFLVLIENQKLAKWFNVRDMEDKASQFSKIDPKASPMEQMKAHFRMLELEEDDDIISYFLEARDTEDKEQSENLSTISSTGNLESAPEQHDDEEDMDKKPKVEDWNGRDFRVRDLTCADLRGYNLSGINFSNANLTDADLSECDLSQASFDGAVLARTKFTNCNIKEAKIINIEFPEQRGWASVRTICTGQNVAEYILEGIEGLYFSNAILDRAVMSGNFFNADLTDVHANQIDASKAEIYRALMHSADFSFSKLYQNGVPEGQKLKAKMFGVKWV